MTAVVQRSFSGGEISPALYARTDVSKYQTGLKKCRNFQVQRHGGVANRAGTIFTAEVKDMTKSIRLMKFVFNSEQTYLMEFGDEYIRFYRNGGQIVVSGVVAWSNATNYVIGDLASRLGVNYYCIAAHINQQPPNAAFWYPLTGDIYEIPTPYAEEDLMDLCYVQSGDVITITHPGYAPRELARTGHTAWTLSAVSFTPTLAAPANLVVTAPGAGTIEWRYQVTAVREETYEESLPSAIDNDPGDEPTLAAPITLAWDAVAGAAEYNVYKETWPGSGTYGFIAIAGSNSFSDPGITPDGTFTPPIDRNPFNGAGNWPSTTTYYQQRQIYANSNNDTERVHGSRTGNFKNFTVSSPSQDDDAVSWTVAARKVQAVRHLLELGKLIVFTAEGEWVILGGVDGAIRPGEVNPELQTENGSSHLAPIIVNKSALYVQARGSVVRDLTFNLDDDGYTGDDLTIFATHLFEHNVLMDWDYQKTPHSIVWAVRDDGTLLGLTYIREHKVLGWHHHDTEKGLFENVCCLPEGDEDTVYVSVFRIINGAEKRYIERFASRRFSDPIDAFFVDSGLTYDGWNTTATTMTLTGGVDWLYTEDLTLTSSAAFFAAGDVGNAIVLYSYIDEDGIERPTVQDSVKLTITGFTSNQIVTVRSNKTVPTWARGVAGTDWSRAVDLLTGFDHLAGETVNILADGNVVTPQEVTLAGEISLPTTYSLVHVGLPIEADLETLDIDTADGVPLTDKYKNVQSVDLVVESSRGIFVGQDEDHLEEWRQRELEDMGDPVALHTGHVTVSIESNWNSNGRVFLRQSDPLPLTVLSIVPSGMIPLGSD